MNQNIITEHRNCKGCGKKYDARILDILGVRLLCGGGYCPECVKVKVVEEDAKERQAEQARIVTQRRQWRNSCGIFPKFMNEDFSTFEKHRQEKALKECFDYAEQFPIGKSAGYRSLVLFSNESWGVGKTHLACAIAHRILDRWNGEAISCPVRFVSETDLFMRIQDTYNHNQEERFYLPSERDILYDHIGVPLLILDDVGKRRVHDPRFVQRIMFALIDGRYKSMRPMVITANLNPERLKVYLGGGTGDEASLDRLLEMTRGQFIKMEGASYRRGVKRER